jgi:hypothetical protein
MKAIIIILVILISTLSFAQHKLLEGCYSNCNGSGMASVYLIQFNSDSTFNYSKRTGLSVDEVAGTYHVEQNTIYLEYECVEPDSAYIYFNDSLNQKDSVLIQKPSLNLLMKRPSQLYLVKKKVFFNPGNNKEVRRSKYYLVRK